MRCKIFLRTCIIAAAMCFALPVLGCSSISSPSPDIQPHLISVAESEPYRPITAKPQAELSAVEPDMIDAQFRSRVDELYAVVVFDRKRPVFATDDPVKPIYDNAVAMLDRYILNAWHADGDEYQTVHAIHDYLVSNTVYDFALYDAYQHGNTDLAGNPAFHIDGVFLNGRAVCDGLSRAFNFLCAIEDIEAVRVTGSYASTPHAWNKVKLDGEWYNVDVTADSAYYTIGGSMKKQISHGYFLLSDKTLSEFLPQGHVFGGQSHVASSDLDYYADATLSISGKKFSATVKSQAELNALFSAVSDAKGRVGKIEVKLDFPYKTQINSADMYTAEIAEAYAKLDDPGFDISAGNKPYFRYPNGVYLFLMYK